MKTLEELWVASGVSRKDSIGRERHITTMNRAAQLGWLAYYSKNDEFLASLLEPEVNGLEENSQMLKTLERLVWANKHKKISQDTILGLSRNALQAVTENPTYKTLSDSVRSLVGERLQTA